MDNLELSKHFSLFEFTDSRDRPDMVEENRSEFLIHPRALRRARILCESLLEEARDEFGKPVLVLSGFRMPALNAAVGGAPGSQHMQGEAADITIPGAKMSAVFAWFKRSGLLWHQLIYYPDHNFLHVSLPTGSDDGQVMVR